MHTVLRRITHEVPPLQQSAVASSCELTQLFVRSLWGEMLSLFVYLFWSTQSVTDA
jgi:hypothetical protein